MKKLFAWTNDSFDVFFLGRRPARVKFQKKINNSVAWATDKNGERVIVFGKGISFGKTEGALLESTEIERIFKADDSDTKGIQAIKHAVAEISEDVLALAELISEHGAKLLGIDQFDNSHYLALADHLNYALKRGTENGFDYPENLRWEVRKLYPKEYDAAIDALYLIEKKTGIRLPKSEQPFLTYHFVNAQYDSEINMQSMQLADLMGRSIEIIQYHYHIILNQNSTNYIRFVTHLRYFILRLNHHEEDHLPKVDEQLLKIVKQNYRKAYQAAEKVTKMISIQTKQEISNDEIFYLTLHIDRVTQRKE